MTLAEKVGQLNMVTAHMADTGPGMAPLDLDAVRRGEVGSVFNLWGAENTARVQRVAVEETRLGIPLFFGFDVVHGHRTLFPVPIAEACAFDPDLWQRTAVHAARETSADGVDLTFAPMLDVSRDPRWGRMVESPGEDAWLGMRFAEAKVRGFQGDDIASPHAVAATAKHFAGYAASIAGRDYATVELSERTFREIHLPPFQSALAAGVAAIMPAFTDYSAVPLTGNAAILGDLLRQSWGFDGVILSDYGAIAELVPHGVAADLQDAATVALHAGVDIDMMGNAYLSGLEAAVEHGKVSIDLVDTAVVRVLRLKHALGLLDDPFRRMGENGTWEAIASKGRDLARDAARRSAVLLTNRSGTLPLASSGGPIVVAGPLANAWREMAGPWAGAVDLEQNVSLAFGLEQALPGRELRFPSEDEHGAAMADAETIVLCLGETAEMSGEATSRTKLDLDEDQRRLFDFAAGTGRPLVVVLFCGRPLTVPWIFERADAVVAAWFLGSEAGNALADVLTGAWNPSGRLSVSWPRDVGQIPIFYGQRPSGRPLGVDPKYSSRYIDSPNDPQFVFGHGLSYTAFEMSDLRLSATNLKVGESLEVSVDLRNSGDRAGEQTLMVFLRDPVASVSRPLLELRGFASVFLEPGDSESVSWTLGPEAFEGLDAGMRRTIEPGVFEVFVGPCADVEQLLKVSISIEEKTINY